MQTDKTACNLGFELIYEDDSILVLNKPSGLVSVPGRTPDLSDCLSGRVQRTYPDASIVHRLDMDTSGILIMARSKHSQKILGRMFMNRSIKKIYTAIVHGIVEQDAGKIDLPIGPDWPNRPRQKIDHDTGKPALTHYRKIHVNRKNNTTRMELEPVTGRTHQIRIHLQKLGHPVLGDRLYADTEVRSMSARLLLHARSLCLVHPVTQIEMHFECQAPF